MKTLYLDCGMGAAGDMLSAALYELSNHQNEWIEQMNRMFSPHVTVNALSSEKCGIGGTHMEVKIHGHTEEETIHHHGHTHSATTLHNVAHMLSHLDIPEKVRSDALAVYRLIAEAESHAHQTPVEEVHFSEVGSMDALADVVGVCLLIKELAPDRIIASPIHVGSGSVHCMHGILPVPAPATAFILKDIPIYGGAVQGELCTPTGAALLKHFVDCFGDMPVLRTQKIGYGMGSKDFPRANCLRAFLGESDNGITDQITRLSCNLDDMTGEAIGYAVASLLNAGALDVYTHPIQMKKNRPGIELICLTSPDRSAEFASLMLSLTTTLGVRMEHLERFILSRSIKKIETPYGTVRLKESVGDGIRKHKAEAEDIARIAVESNISFTEAAMLVERYLS